jgi:hypothetical protein
MHDSESAAALASYSSAVRRYSSFLAFIATHDRSVLAYAICRRLYNARRRKGGCAVTR